MQNADPSYQPVPSDEASALDTGCRSPERTVLDDEAEGAKRPFVSRSEAEDDSSQMWFHIKEAGSICIRDTAKLAGFVALGSLLAMDMLMAFTVRVQFFNPHNGEAMSWQPYIVLNGVAVSIGLMVMGLPADLLLLGLSSFFCALGIITTNQLLGGLSNEGVVAVAALCCVSAAIDKTKALNGLMGGALGSPKSTSYAIIRMAIPVVCLGTVFNNTPLVAVMIPIVKDWTKKLGHQASHFMMPLSFVTMLSACMTTMGSSTNLLAVQLVPEAEIAFLDMAPVGFVVMVTGVLYCALIGPYLLPSNGIAGGDSEPTAGKKVERAELLDDCCGPDADRYTVSLNIGQQGPLFGKRLEESGLPKAVAEPASIKPVGDVDFKKQLEWGDELVAVNATATDIACLASIPGLTLRALGLSLLTSAHQKRRRESLANEPGAKGRFHLPAGKWVAGSDGGGYQNRKRSLYQVVLAPGGLNTDRRGPDDSGQARLADLQRPLSEIEVTLVAVRGCSLKDQSAMTLRGGEVLLVEALNTRLIEGCDMFSLVNRIPDGQPPMSIVLSPLDPYRSLLAVAGLVITVALAALEIAPLDPVAVLAAMASIVLGTLGPKDLYAAINGPVLLTVAASFGVGAAIEDTGLASKLASTVMQLAEDGGPTCILSSVMVLALGLGVVVSNNTTVILLAPLVKDICERQGMSLKMTMLAVIYAANLSFATPFSYQTNMMVMPHGQYVFMDYVKFGVPMMLLCGTVALISTYLYWG